MSERAQSERLKGLWQLATRRDLDESARFHALLAQASAVLDMDLAVFGALNGSYTARYAHDTLGVLPEGTVLPLDEAICREVYQKREPLFISDLADSIYRSHPLLTEAGLHAYAGVPVWAGDQIEGVLAFMRRRPISGTWPEADLAYMELVSGWMG
jgi:GAF domain-containing protein